MQIYWDNTMTCLFILINKNVFDPNRLHLDILEKKQSHRETRNAAAKPNKNAKTKAQIPFDLLRRYISTFE